MRLNLTKEFADFLFTVQACDATMFNKFSEAWLKKNSRHGKVFRFFFKIPAMVFMASSLRLPRQNCGVAITLSASQWAASVCILNALLKF